MASVSGVRACARSRAAPPVHLLCLCRCHRQNRGSLIKSSLAFRSRAGLTSGALFSKRTILVAFAVCVVYFCPHFQSTKESSENNHFRYFFPPFPRCRTGPMWDWLPVGQNDHFDLLALDSIVFCGFRADGVFVVFCRLRCASLGSGAHRALKSAFTFARSRAEPGREFYTIRIL